MCPVTYKSDSITVSEVCPMRHRSGSVKVHKMCPMVYRSGTNTANEVFPVAYGCKHNCLNEVCPMTYEPVASRSVKYIMLHTYLVISWWMQSDLLHGDLVPCQVTYRSRTVKLHTDLVPSS